MDQPAEAPPREREDATADAPEAPGPSLSGVRPVVAVEAVMPPTDADFLAAAERANDALAQKGDPFAYAFAPPTPADDEQQRAEDRAFKDRAAGVVVPPGEKPMVDYIDPIDSFLAADADELPFKDIPIPRRHTVLRMRALSTPHYSRLVEQFTVTRRDPETGERLEQTKDRELRCQLIMDSCENLDFHDERLYARFGLRSKDPYVLLERMFLPGEVAQLSEWVMRVSGGERLYQEETAKGF